MTDRTRFQSNAPRLLLAAIAAAVCGCSAGVAHPVDPEAARVALKTTLDAWKEGKTPDSLQAGSPAIVAQDVEWSSGAKLLEYALVTDKPADANLDARVTLTVSSKGKTRKRDARYLVTTSPSVTVFRDMMN